MCDNVEVMATGQTAGCAGWDLVEVATREKPRCVLSSGEMQGQPGKSLESDGNGCPALGALHMPGTKLSDRPQGPHEPAGPHKNRTVGAGMVPTLQMGKQLWGRHSHAAGSGGGPAPTRGSLSVCVTLGVS